jgi:hypothetical protein
MPVNVSKPVSCLPISGSSHRSSLGSIQSPRKPRSFDPSKDTFESSPKSLGAELTWLGPALAQAAGENRAPTAWTYAKGAAKVVGGFFSVLATIGALGVLALLQSFETSKDKKTEA